METRLKIKDRDCRVLSTARVRATKSSFIIQWSLSCSRSGRQFFFPLRTVESDLLSTIVVRLRWHVLKRAFFSQALTDEDKNHLRGVYMPLTTVQYFPTCSLLTYKYSQFSVSSLTILYFACF
ncbi:hypothetical protein BDZ91DRAFT_739534 [Kalaharituber pfeilii]|nr:hypothetical protein BDZ91DRAFT_739534 [Kalaharituber pfeilii]